MPIVTNIEKVKSRHVWDSRGSREGQCTTGATCGNIDEDFL